MAISALFSMALLLGSFVLCNALGSPYHTAPAISTWKPSTYKYIRSDSAPLLMPTKKKGIIHVLSRRGGGGGGSGGSGFISTTRSSSLKMSPISFDNTMFFQSAGTFGVTNAVGLLISLATGSHVHLDLFGAGAFAMAAIIPILLSQNFNEISSLRVGISCVAQALWGIKLAAFLFYRALKVKHDARLDDLLNTTSGTFGFWLLTLLWGILCSLPHALGMTSSYSGDRFSITIGTTLYIFGLIIESLADWQKWMFKATTHNSPDDQFCNVGLWSISQHPNYFGNIILWVGIYILNAPALVVPGNVLGTWRLIVSFLSPVFLWITFSGQANGTVGNAFQLKQAKYGGNPDYVRYAETIPKIVPNLLSLLKRKK